MVYFSFICILACSRFVHWALQELPIQTGLGWIWVNSPPLFVWTRSWGIFSLYKLKVDNYPPLLLLSVGRLLYEGPSVRGSQMRGLAWPGPGHSSCLTCWWAQIDSAWSMNSSERRQVWTWLVSISIEIDLPYILHVVQLVRLVQLLGHTNSDIHGRGCLIWIRLRQYLKENSFGETKRKSISWLRL